MDRREGHAGENAAAENTGGSYCAQCNKEFVQLVMHNLIIHQSLPERRCTICGMLFRSPNRLCSHLVDHRSSERRCFECCREFADTLDLLVHLDDHPSEHIYSCLTCGSGFASRFRLLDHTETSCSDNAHGATPSPPPPPPPPQTSLSETESEGYSTADSRKERITVVIGANGFWHHMEAKKQMADRLKENDRNNINRKSLTPDKPSKGQEEEYTGESTEMSDELQIAECAGKDSGTEEMKEESIKAEEDMSVKLENVAEEPKPNVVGKQASGFRKLKNTVQRKGKATTPGFRCRFCKKDLSNRKTLKYHELRHTGDLKYKCAKCDLRFPALYKLKEHSERHNPEFAKNLKATQKKTVDNEQQIQYRCSHCNRWWSRKHQVATHLSVDSTCCGQDFGCWTAKARHVQSTHPGQKVFKCPSCPAAAYTTSAQLKRHTAVVHKSTLKSKTSFTCPVCAHKTTSMHNLRRHQRRNGCRLPKRRLLQQSPAKT